MQRDKSTYGYEVFADGLFQQWHAGLIGAVVEARTGAQAKPGAKFSIENNTTGNEDARYRVVAGKLEAWVR